jgi:hypothetical protein
LTKQKVEQGWNQKKNLIQWIIKKKIITKRKGTK